MSTAGNSSLNARSGGGRIAVPANIVKPPRSGRVFLVLLLAVIVAFLFGVLLFGVRIYQSANSDRIENDDRRLAVALIGNSLRVNDVADAVNVGAGPEGDSLVLVENINGTLYETRIYHYEGNIVEEYTVAEAPYAPARARTIVTSETFDFSYTEGLLTVTTDHGETQIAFRSDRGGA